MLTLDPSSLVDKAIELMTMLLVEIPGKLISTTLDSGVVFTIWEKFFGNAEVIQAAFLLALSMGIYTAYTKHDVLQRDSNDGGVM